MLNKILSSEFYKIRQTKTHTKKILYIVIIANIGIKSSNHVNMNQIIKRQKDCEYGIEIYVLIDKIIYLIL